jgi:hypothetical protein
MVKVSIKKAVDFLIRLVNVECAEPSDALNLPGHLPFNNDSI